jgi:hypothetical protein
MAKGIDSTPAGTEKILRELNPTGADELLKRRYQYITYGDGDPYWDEGS